jgi:2-methylfumaryl-CoA isomerase
MFPVLNDLRVVEGASFVAAPSCTMHLAQLGAEVIRFDPIGGGPDFRRWPQARNGSSYFWEGLNKGKKSIALDLRHPEGRELAIALITAPGPGAGLFVTNFPHKGFLAHEPLAARRPDLITVRIMGHANGRQAVDYTVNPLVGLPYLTGPEELGEAPVNHVLPAWDLLAGMQAAFTLLAAERLRQRTGAGQELRLPLSDLAMATVGHLGQIAEAVEGHSRPRYGNALYGAFGRDFLTADGCRIMLVGLTKGQWAALVRCLNIGPQIAALEATLGLSFADDEGLRFEHRAPLFEIVAAAVARETYASLTPRLEVEGACWSPYRTLTQALNEDPDLSATNPLFTEITHPSGASYLTPGHATHFGALRREPPTPAPRLGEHTEQILSEVLGLPSEEIARLHDRHIVASA